ncbi:MAG: hypothetical protein IJ906_13105, partial [Oscillospiraceae bacterium]|nr:hypothetical protein [Oscillospiraceae bacterium]
DAEKDELHHIFCEELGTEAECTTWTGNAPLLAFLRLQTGIADEAIQTKFGSILQNPELDEMQREYMQQIIDYAKKNGDISFSDLLQKSPFCDYDIMELFDDKVILVKQLVNGIHKPVQ